MSNVTLETLSMEQLKAACWDNLCIIEQRQHALNALKLEIQRRQSLPKPEEEPGPEEEAKKPEEGK